jgi:hypothetical protein
MREREVGVQRAGAQRLPDCDLPEEMTPGAVRYRSPGFVSYAQTLRPLSLR